MTIDASHLNIQISAEHKHLRCITTSQPCLQTKPKEQCCHGCIPTPTAQACRDAVQGTAVPHSCMPRQRGGTWNCAYGSGGTVNTLPWPMTSTTSYHNHITKDMNHLCKILTRAKVWSPCTQKTSLLMQWSLISANTRGSFVRQRGLN